jgi:hypothetical protein
VAMKERRQFLKTALGVLAGASVLFTSFPPFSPIPVGRGAKNHPSQRDEEGESRPKKPCQPRYPQFGYHTAEGFPDHGNDRI